MRVLLGFSMAALITLTLAGCSDSGGGSGSNLDSQITLPDDSDIPETPVEETESDGSTNSEDGFTARRFLVQGDSDSGYATPGIKAIPADNNSNIDTVDAQALPGVQLFTIPVREMSDGAERLKPAGIFYRRSDQFRFAGASTADTPRQVTSESSVDSTCVADISYDTATFAQTAVAFNRARDSDSTSCPSRFTDGLQWHQLTIGDDDSTSAQTFGSGQTPVVPLNAADGNPPEWLVLDRSGSEPQLARVSSDDLGTPTPVDGSTELAGSLDEIHRLTRLNPGSLLLAYGTPAMDGVAASFRLAHYDRASNSINDLTAGEDVNSTLRLLPRRSWIATDDGKAYVGLGNALLEVDSEQYSLLDAVGGAGTPFFVMSSDTHVVWGALSRVDGGDRRQVRLVRHGNQGGSPLVNAPYLETRTLGTAGGWFYFTVARGVQDNGRLSTAFAIGINPDQSNNNAFILANAQWIGGSIDNGTSNAPQNLAAGAATDVFFRSGSDDRMREIRALEDPSNPLQEVEGGVRLPVVTLGTLPESFSAVFMGEGFGPQRLLTAVNVASSEDIGGENELEPGEFSVTNRVYHLDPRTPDSLSSVSENDGSLVRALALF